MNKYMIYFNEAGIKYYGKTCDYVFANDEQDALLRSKYKEQYVDDIFIHYY